MRLGSGGNLVQWTQIVETLHVASPMASTHPTNAHSAPPFHNRGRQSSEMQEDLGELEDFDLFNGALLDSDLSPMVNQLSDDTDRDDKYSQFKQEM